VRVLFYYSSRSSTGAARVFAAAGRGLAERGYQVTYVCPPNGAVGARAAAEGCDVIHLDPNAPVAVEGWRLQRILTERFIETVFVHSEREQLAVSLAVRLAGRGGVVRRTPAGGRFVAGRATRLALRLATGGFVFASEAEVQAAAGLGVERVRETVVADLGVDVDRYDELRAAPLATVGAAPGSRIIVCVYDPSGKQRAATVLRTMGLLAPRHPELHLVLIGPDSGNEDLRMHAAALGITRAVSHVGERDDDLAVLRAGVLGWVVAGEDSAGFGALDFMAMRTPVLVDRGSVAQRYVADGITGVALPPGDATATASVVAELLANDAQREAMGNAGRVRVARDYSERAMLDAMQRATESGRDRTRWSA